MWYMRPVRVSIDVPQNREDVYEFLDVMANHEQFTDHMLHDWEYAGPPRGVGSRARVHVTVGGRTETIEMQVVAAERPVSIVERNVGAGGRRVATGTYMLQDLRGGGTRIAFEYAWESAPVSERLLSGVVRGVLRRGNRRAMERLAQRLARRGAETPAAAGGEAPPAAA
jgi:carbon monoxide dehydrogenase subunit G